VVQPISQDASPRVVAVLVNKTFTFEFWAEGEKLLGNLDIVMALAAFYHLCFVMDMNYPKGGQTVADLSQMRVC